MSNKTYTKFAIHIYIKKDMANFKFYPLQKNFKMTTFEDMSSFLVRVQKKIPKGFKGGGIF